MWLASRARPGYRRIAVRLNHVTLAAGDVESSARFDARLGLEQIVGAVTARAAQR